MRWSRMLIPTLREEPKDAEATSHKLMLRAGLIRKLSSGVYSYLPLGFRVLQNIIMIVREEMNRAGAQEVLLPAIHPPEIWQQTGRYEVLKDILMKVSGGAGHEFVLGPTHEEIITELAAGYIASYKDLPMTLYQIQTKFRNEARPRFGVIRSKEFIMKDAYSFDTSWEALDVSYKTMYHAYQRIFDRCGLTYAIVSADSGAMGGDVSHEFMVKVPFGEDVVVTCPSCELSASLEVAACGDPPAVSSPPMMLAREEFATPGTTTIEALTAKYRIPAERMVKTLLYVADGKPVVCLVRGDHTLCETKVKKVLKATSLALADEKTIETLTGAPVGFAGPVGLRHVQTMLADFSVRHLNNFVTGANKKDTHVMNVNFGRDVTGETYADIRYITASDQCPLCHKATVRLESALEIGHVFKLGTKYSKALNAKYSDAAGALSEVIMGCYGIGVNRILASAIELHHDAKGISWPLAIAPFSIALVTPNQAQESCAAFASRLYDELTGRGVDVLYDDRDVRAGVKFNDVELIGIPIVVVIGERNLNNNAVEVKVRKDGSTKLVPVADLQHVLDTMLGTV